tara:strand:- start:1278 stop:1853 length:576 start_codon:yes stop_codon:yes gene_type:complete
MIRIGLTGGIGVGKTYVSKILQKLEVPVFNSDLEAKHIMSKDKDLISKIKESFGNLIYNNNILQKDILSNIVFNNKARLKELNSLVHPVVSKKFQDWCSNQDCLFVVKEAAILFETDSYLDLDFIICVSANRNLVIDRVKNRDKISEEEVKKRINSQMPQSQKEDLSDFVIVNDGKQLLLPQIIKVLKEIE